MKHRMSIIALSIFLSSCANFSAIQNEAIESKVIAMVNAHADCISPLKEKNFSKLGEKLNFLHKAYEESYSNERKLWLYLDCFMQTNEDVESKLDDWVSKEPSSPFPYLARGIYFHNIAGKKRGTKWIDKTTKKQIEAFRYYTDLGISDLNQALELRPNTQSAYWYLIELNNGILGYSPIVKELYETGLGINPLSYVIRRHYMMSLRPRWGGSYDLMNELIAETEKYVNQNQNLRWLSGAVLEDRASMQEINRRYVSALENYNRALEYGDEPNAFHGRAIVQYNMRAYEKAYIDIEKAISIRPTKHDYHRWKAMIKRKL